MGSINPQGGKQEGADIVGGGVGVGALHRRVHKGVERCHRHRNLQDEDDGNH